MTSLRLPFLLASLITCCQGFIAHLDKVSVARTMGSTTATSAAVQLAQYAPQAISLFNNMKTPASILAGAIVGLGFGSPLNVQSPDGVEETGLEKFLRKSYLIVAAISLLSELIAIMWSTVAVNQLTERVIAPAPSVWHLLQRDFDLSWAAVNSHFMLGMFAFSYIIGVRGYFMAGRGLLGQGMAGLSFSALLYMVAIVNSGISGGGGVEGQSYGKSVVGLFLHYITLSFKKNLNIIRPLEIGSFAVGAMALIQGIRGVKQLFDGEKLSKLKES